MKLPVIRVKIRADTARGYEYQELTIEGFGPRTIVGAVEDVLSGAYTPPNKARVISFTVYPNGIPDEIWPDLDKQFNPITLGE